MILWRRLRRQYSQISGHGSCNRRKRNQYVHAVTFIDLTTNTRMLQMKKGPAPFDEKQMFDLSGEATFVAIRLAEECEVLLTLFLELNRAPSEFCPVGIRIAGEMRRTLGSGMRGGRHAHFAESFWGAARCLHISGNNSIGRHSHSRPALSQIAFPEKPSPGPRYVSFGKTQHRVPYTGR